MKTKYTVLMLYPDYIASSYGQETYLAHVTATTAKGAVRAAQRQAANAQGADEVEDPSDFYVIFMCKGHTEDVTPC